MKTKKEGKFTLEKFEVAKLKSSTMRKIVGGLGNDDVITGTGAAGQNSSIRCIKPQTP
jgi:hypothetical protein